MFLVSVPRTAESGNTTTLLGSIFSLVLFKDSVTCLVGPVQKAVEISMHEKNDIRRFKVTKLTEITLDDTDKESE